MTNITVSESFQPPVSDRDLVAVEQQLGITLPPDYKEFLLAHNGGIPDPSVFPIMGNTSGTEGILDWLFGIGKHERPNLVDEANMSRDRVPPELLPIGIDPGGNLICLAVSGPNRNRVYFWDHEEEADYGETPSYDNVYFVANSFTDLLHSLT